MKTKSIAVKKIKLSEQYKTANYRKEVIATLPEIADVLGHKTLQMVKRYDHLSKAHSHDVVK
jgi:hypothetical protein